MTNEKATDLVMALIKLTQNREINWQRDSKALYRTEENDLCIGIGEAKGILCFMLDGAGAYDSMENIVGLKELYGLVKELCQTAEEIIDAIIERANN